MSAERGMSGDVARGVWLHGVRFNSKC